MEHDVTLATCPVVPGSPASPTRRNPPRPSAGTGLALPLFLAFSGALAACAPIEALSGSDAASHDGSTTAITVTPLEAAPIGPENDFEPEGRRRTFLLTNTSGTARTFEAEVSEDWVSAPSPASGTLAPGESVEVAVEVDLEAPSLAETDPAVAELTFVDGATREVVATRGIRVGSGFEEMRVGNTGWTQLRPSPDSRTVYVSSSSGNDANDGLSEATPKRTVAAGIAQLRHGFPDWLLLKRGDVWQEGLGQWIRSGRNQDEPMVVTTYGDARARPLLRTGAQSAIRTNGGGGSPATVDDLALVGLHFHADTYTGGGDCFGGQFLQPGSRLLIEDCMFQGYGTNLVFQGYGGRHTDFKLRRSHILDAYTIHSIGGHSQGMYVYGVDGLLIEENVFDHNGWNENVPGAHADIYSHNMYIDNGNTGVTVRGNLVANGSSHGLQLRCGGSVVNNLFVRNSIALLVGGGNNPEPGGVTADVRGNVILDGKNIDGANPRGWGIVISNLASGRVNYNVIANNDIGAQPAVMILDGDAMGDNGPTIGIHDTEIKGNIVYNWGGGVLVEGDPSKITNIVFTGNDLQSLVTPWPLISHSHAGNTGSFQAGGNRFFDQLVPSGSWTLIANVPRSIDYWKTQVGDTTSVSQQASYAEPDRSIPAYHVTLGGSAQLDAFLAEVREQSSAHWRIGYLAARANRYIRRGF